MFNSSARVALTYALPELNQFSNDCSTQSYRFKFKVLIKLKKAIKSKFNILENSRIKKKKYCVKIPALDKFLNKSKFLPPRALSTGTI